MLNFEKFDSVEAEIVAAIAGYKGLLAHAALALEATVDLTVEACRNNPALMEKIPLATYALNQVDSWLACKYEELMEEFNLQPVSVDEEIVKEQTSSAEFAEAVEGCRESTAQAMKYFKDTYPAFEEAIYWNEMSKGIEAMQQYQLHIMKAAAQPA